jgi:hypothetical protein
MPTKKQRVRLHRLQHQLDFDHPGVRNRPIAMSRHNLGKVKHPEQHTLLDQPFFVLNDVAYANILKDLQSGARFAAQQSMFLTGKKDHDGEPGNFFQLYYAARDTVNIRVGFRFNNKRVQMSIIETAGDKYISVYGQD